MMNWYRFLAFLLSRKNRNWSEWNQQNSLCKFRSWKTKDVKLPFMQISLVLSALQTTSSEVRSNLVGSYRNKTELILYFSWKNNFFNSKVQKVHNLVFILFILQCERHKMFVEVVWIKNSMVFFSKISENCFMISLKLSWDRFKI